MKKSKHNASSGKPEGSRSSSGDSSGSSSVRGVVKETGNEPVASRAPMPVILIALLGGLVYWGSMHILEFGGEADARVHYPYTSFKELEGLQPKGAEEQFIAKGALGYAKICASCHQNDGGGGVAQNAPPLAGSEWVLPKDPSRIIRIVLHGLSGPITVKGKEYGAGVMGPWKDVFSDEDIAALLSYVRNSWGNKAPLVTAEQVKKVRAETKDRPSYMSVPDLMGVTLKE